MSTTEIKNEINRVIDTMPDSMLEMILNHLKNLAIKDEQDLKQLEDIRKIFEEDDELLRMLAQ